LTFADSTPLTLGTGDCLLPQPFQITRTRREAPGVVTIELAPPAAFSFAAGQFNMLYAFGLGEVAISLSGDPGNVNRIVHTVRAVGSVSTALTRLRSGTTIGVRGPYGSAWPVTESEGGDIVIVAGGLGWRRCGPRSMACSLAANGTAGSSCFMAPAAPVTSSFGASSKCGDGASMSMSR
jgi:hypothetical protein